jgi:hypothetical protein
LAKIDPGNKDKPMKIVQTKDFTTVDKQTATDLMILVDRLSLSSDILVISKPPFEE